MVASFFGKSDHVATFPPEDRRTVAADWYVDHCFPKVIDASAAQRLDSWPFFLHHDNASAHTAATTVAFLNESEVQLLPHPPYSPDLSPCDFFLFPEVKKQRKGTLLESAEDACRAFTRAVFKTHPNQAGMRSGTVALPYGKVHSCGRKVLWKNGVSLCPVSPISNEYPETFGASLVCEQIQISSKQH